MPKKQQFEKGQYVVFRVHCTGLSNNTIKSALSRLPGNPQYTTVIPATESENGKAHADGEVRSRFGALWRGDAEEGAYIESLNGAFGGITPVIEVAAWESVATLWWEDRPLPTWPNTLAEQQKKAVKP